MCEKMLIAIVCLCVCSSALPAQQLKQTKLVQARVFTKTIEQNLIRTDDKTKKEYNFAGKTDLEKLFFGDLNAEVEYLMIPPFAGAYGLRIVKTKPNASCKLEIKYIANHEKVDSLTAEKFSIGSMNIEEMLAMSDEEQDRMANANTIKLTAREEERLKLYKIKTLATPVSDTFAKTLHTEIVLAMSELESEKKVPGMIFDPDKIIFRCIVRDELWTLTYRNPQGKIEELSDLCRQIIADVKAGTFDEANYIKLLER